MRGKKQGLNELSFSISRVQLGTVEVLIILLKETQSQDTLKW